VSKSNQKNEKRQTEKYSVKQKKESQKTKTGCKQKEHTKIVKNQTIKFPKILNKSFKTKTKTKQNE